jgi:hypothetical protein
MKTSARWSRWEIEHIHLIRIFLFLNFTKCAFDICTQHSHIAAKGPFSMGFCLSKGAKDCCNVYATHIKSLSTILKKEHPEWLNLHLQNLSLENLNNPLKFSWAIIKTGMKQLHWGIEHIHLVKIFLFSSFTKCAFEICTQHSHISKNGRITPILALFHSRISILRFNPL